MLSAAEDYETLASSTVTFSPAQTSATVSVTLVDDDVLEDVEQFTVEVVATGGQERVDVGDAANISISNDDCETLFICTPFSINTLSVCVHFSLIFSAVTVGFFSTVYSISEDDRFANVSLELTEAAEKEVAVLLETGNGTAKGSNRMAAGGSRWQVLFILQLPVTIMQYHKM